MIKSKQKQEEEQAEFEIINLSNEEHRKLIDEWCDRQLKMLKNHMKEEENEVIIS